MINTVLHRWDDLPLQIQTAFLNYLKFSRAVTAVYYTPEARVMQNYTCPPTGPEWVEVTATVRIPITVLSAEERAK